jgi:RimJ/RimL family protein N-acetyltransferase
MLGELAEVFGVKRATASVDPRNAASIGLLAKLGFTRDADASGADLHFIRDL